MSQLVHVKRMGLFDKVVRDALGKCSADVYRVECGSAY